MKKADNGVLKIRVLLVYVLVFYGLWTVWEFFASPFISSTVKNEYIAQFIKSGIIKNIVWTLPAFFLISHFKDSVYIGLKDMFTTRVILLKYLPIFALFTVHLLVGAVLRNGRIAISKAFAPSDLIIVLFVGITEETVFRGWLLNAVFDEKHKWKYIIINAIMFLLIHFPKWIHTGAFFENIQNFGFIGIIVLSIIFSWTFIKSKNIIIPITLHMYWDLLVFMLY